MKNKIEKNDEVEFKAHGIHRWGRVISIDRESGRLLVGLNIGEYGTIYPVDIQEVISYRH